MQELHRTSSHRLFSPFVTPCRFSAETDSRRSTIDPTVNPLELIFPKPYLRSTKHMLSPSRRYSGLARLLIGKKPVTQPVYATRMS